jgi:hydrogenase expression/formation protein HypD
MLVRQLEAGESRVDIEYVRGVSYDGNGIALAFMDRVFEITASEWRGLGTVGDTGLVLKDEFGDFDASPYIEKEIEQVPEPPGCRCGEVLRGRISPLECPLFRKVCTPEKPVGPCMVSSEGSCATYYQYAGAANG